MRLFGLIGYPLTHSFSKNYFAEKFAREGIDDCRYENFQMQNIAELKNTIAQNQDLRGLNVTIPHKESVLNFLSERDHLVQQTGACNCIKIENEKLLGFNTDVIGFEKSLKSKLKSNHVRALILGTGGAAKAVEFVLNKNGIDFVRVSRRAHEKQLTYPELTPEILESHTLIINTTPIGMYPRIDEMPEIPYEALGPNHFLFDLIYNPATTIFLKKGEEKGTITQNGYDMLVYQAEESWQIWNNTSV